MVAEFAELLGTPSLAMIPGACVREFLAIGSRSLHLILLPFAFSYKRTKNKK
jgi:hypothetical protein